MIINVDNTKDYYFCSNCGKIIYSDIIYKKDNKKFCLSCLFKHHNFNESMDCRSEIFKKFYNSEEIKKYYKKANFFDIDD